MAHQMLRLGHLRRVGLLALTILLPSLLLVAQFTLFSSQASAESKEITVRRVGMKIEYPVYVPPLNVAWESPGRGWFTSPSEDVIGIVTRQSGADDELISVSIDFLTQEEGSQPYDIAIANGTVWFTLFGSNQLARIDLVTVSTTVIPTPTHYYIIPTADSGPSGIAVAPDGMVWIVSANSPTVTRFDPVSETFAQWSYADRLAAGGSVSTARTYPDVATNHENQIWFTVPGSDRMLGYDVGAGTFSVHSLDNPAFPAREPAGITVDNRPSPYWDGGYPWITAYDTGVVGRFAPGSLAGWDWFRTNTQNSGPRGIAFKDNGAMWDIWYTQERSAYVGRLVVTPGYDLLASVDVPLPEASQPWGIVTGEDDTVWFAESGRHTVSEIRPPYVTITRLPVVFGE